MKYFISVILSMLTVSAASAQITLSEQDYLSGLASASNGSTFITRNVTGLQALVNLSGDNQTWNFTNQTWSPGPDSTTSSLLTDPTSAPLSSNFPGATHVIKLTALPTNFDQTTLYEFVKINANGVWNLGFSQDSAGAQSVLETFKPAEQLLAFPLTNGTSWSSASSISSPKVPSGFSDSTLMTSTIDGFGTLVTPAVPSGVMTLRQKQETISKESYPPYLSIESRSFSYTWITTGFNQASIGADSNQKPIEASYSTASGSGVSSSSSASDPFSLYLSQNPASNVETKLYYSLEAAGPVQVEMMDALGRNVRLLNEGIGHAGENIIPIDPTTLAAGTYFIRLEANGTSAMQKLIIR